MKAAEQARLAYLGSNQAECVPWDELKPEVRERWDLVVRTVKQDAHYDDAANAEHVHELRAQLQAVTAERDALRQPVDADAWKKEFSARDFHTERLGIKFVTGNGKSLGVQFISASGYHGMNISNENAARAALEGE